MLQTGKLNTDLSKLLALLEQRIMSVYILQRDLERKSKKLMVNFKMLFALEFMKIVQRKRQEEEQLKRTWVPHDDQ